MDHCYVTANDCTGDVDCQCSCEGCASRLEIDGDDDEVSGEESF